MSAQPYREPVINLIDELRSIKEQKYNQYVSWFINDEEGREAVSKAVSTIINELRNNAAEGFAYGYYNVSTNVPKYRNDTNQKYTGKLITMAFFDVVKTRLSKFDERFYIDMNDAYIRVKYNFDGSPVAK